MVREWNLALENTGGKKGIKDPIHYKVECNEVQVRTGKENSTQQAIEVYEAVSRSAMSYQSICWLESVGLRKDPNAANPNVPLHHVDDRLKSLHLHHHVHDVVRNEAVHVHHEGQQDIQSLQAQGFESAAAQGPLHRHQSCYTRSRHLQVQQHGNSSSPAVRLGGAALTEDLSGDKRRHTERLTCKPTLLQ